MNMVERVARAIVASRGLPEGCELDWDAFLRDARAAIAAMRVSNDDFDPSWMSMDGPDVINAYIDAVLKE